MDYRERNIPIIDDWERFKKQHSGSDELFGFPTFFNNNQLVTFMTVDEYDKYLKRHDIITKEENK